VEWSAKGMRPGIYLRLIARNLAGFPAKSGDDFSAELYVRREVFQIIVAKLYKEKTSGSGSPRVRVQPNLQRAHVGQELAIASGFAELINQQLHRFNR